MSDTFDIPFDGDLAPLQAAIDRVVAAVEKMGATIAGAFDRANASIGASAAKMGALQGHANAAAAAQLKTAAAAESTGAKIMTIGRAAISAGTMIGNLSAGLGHVASIMTALSSNNFGTMLQNVQQIGAGTKRVVSSLFKALQELGTNKGFWKVAAGAAAGIGAVLALRTAFRTVTGTIALARNTIAGFFKGIVATARSAAQQVANAFKSITAAPGKLMGGMGGALPFAGMIGGLGGLAAAATLAVSAVNKAAQMETLETAFAPLIGGSENAKKRIKELSNFAAATPFELPEIAKGSRVLETLTKGALSTGDGLRMVGDVAAATQQPFEEIAMWVGRLYDGLQSGRPVGEATMRLQELGVVSGDVRGRLESMQKAGVAGNAIWGEAAAALNRFSGSMERQSVTWSGKLSTLRDNIGQVLAAFGTPIIDGLKPYLDMAIAKVGSLQNAATAAGEKIRNAMDIAGAAWNMNMVGRLLGTGLQVAMFEAINTLTAGFRASVAFLSTAMKGVMTAISKSLAESGITAVFMTLADLIGARISAAIASALKHVPGLSRMGEVEKEENARAEIMGNVANFLLSRMDFGRGFDALGSEMTKAYEDAKAAFAATEEGDRLINTDEAKGKLEELLNILGAAAQRSRSAVAEQLKAMDDRLQNPNGTGFAGATAINTAVTKGQNQFTSLARVGGGSGSGFASFAPMVSEQKKANTILYQIREKIGSNQPLPVIV